MSRSLVRPHAYFDNVRKRKLVTIMIKDQTIAGIATGGGISSISVIRLSGPMSLPVTAKLFRGKNNRPLFDIKPFSLRYGHMVDEGNEVIDEVLVSYFAAPFSYTGEDVVEISCHGGPLPVRKILEVLLKQDLRLAEPGEFTKRAFLNGRIDLSQAEAVMDVISSRTEAALKAANDQSRGHLSQEINALRNDLLNVMAKIEVTLDFPDDELDRSESLALAEELSQVSARMGKLLATAEQGKLLREGYKVVIAGKPNVGKSSLLNALLKEQRAIVTDIPGTTRDVIEEFLNLDGIPLRLTDTAGIRETLDPIEAMGVERSRNSLEEADLIILVLDLSRPLSLEDEELLEKTKDYPRLVLLNKEDLPKMAQIPEEIAQEALTISAANHYGLDQVRAALGAKSQTLPAQGEVLITTSRHKDALEKSQKALEEAISAIHQEVPLDLVTIDINSAWSLLGEITGSTLQDDLVDRIFSGFCIGK